MFHLFHLQSPVGGQWDGLGHAISTDLVHWKTCEFIPMRGPSGAWDCGHTLTGMVIQYRDQYAMTFGSSPPQQIGVMFSPDLYKWTKYPRNPVLKPVPPYADKKNIDWRDAYMFKVDDGYEALICARMPNGQACIARMQSKNLIYWNALPPIATPKVFQCEVPEYFTMGDKHYLIFSCGRPIDDKSRKNTRGTRYLISDSRTGNYVMPEDSLLLGSGNGRLDCYVGRTIEMNGKRMLYYQNCGPRPSAGAPKIIQQNENGTLWAKYWDGLAGLETGAVPSKINRKVLKDVEWKLEANRLVGCKDHGVSIFILPPVVSDFNLTCTINIEKGNRGALVFRYDEKIQKGLVFILDAKSGNVEIAGIEEGQVATRDAVMLDLQTSQEHIVRIFVRSEFADCYVDDKFIFSTVVDDHPLSGKIGFVVDSAVTSFSNLRIASLKSL